MGVLFLSLLVALPSEAKPELGWLVADLFGFHDIQHGDDDDGLGSVFAANKIFAGLPVVHSFSALNVRMRSPPPPT